MKTHSHFGRLHDVRSSIVSNAASTFVSASVHHLKGGRNDSLITVLFCIASRIYAICCPPSER